MPSYYRVVYRKLQHKKNKTWENDGFLKTDSNQVILYSETLEVIQAKKSAIAVEIGREYRLGNNEYMVEDSISSLPADMVDDLISNKENESTKTRAGIASTSSVPRSLNLFNAKGKYDSARSFHLHKKSKPIGSQPLPRIDKLEIDPFLKKLLREHQREGVKFMFDSVMGYNNINGHGCILADEMGLGKSVQAITLIWVLTKQQPAIIKRTVLVCPVSLIGNWKQEFKKWLGLSRMSIFTVGPTTTTVAEFFIGRVYSVLIIGYERLQKFELELTSGEIDLVICDEGHRLKNKCTVVSALLNRLKTKRRVILTGTPVQNNLEEYVELINFVNPGTIMHSKSDLDRLDEQMISQIKIETQSMILRRSSKVNERYLKSKTEYFIFCRVSENQKKEYQSVIEKGERNCLSTISKLQQIANHTSARDISIQLASSKFFVVQQLLVEIERKREKFVLFSHFTSSLDMFSSFFTTKQWKFVRLDGSTPERDRQHLINKFNSDPSIVGFLTSTKAGGVGINLVAASKLIMLDLSWNPAQDTQAAARVWRQGQLHPVNIYRFFSTGTIEEKVLFRQHQKINLSTTLENVSTNSSVRIDKEEYESLISFDGDTNCLYHDLLKCKNDQKCLESHLAPPFQGVYESSLNSAIINSGSIVSFIISTISNPEH